MDILLIDPPYNSLKGMTSDCGYNIGLTSLAAYLRQNGIETGVVMGDLMMDLPSIDGWLASSLKDDAERQAEYAMITGNENHPVWTRMATFIRQHRPKAVGIAFLTPLKRSADMVARVVKKIDPAIKVIAGAAHPTFCADEVMRNPDVDFAIRGEGEVPLLNLVKEIMNPSPSWEGVGGICYRDQDGKTRSIPGVPLLHDLDELPFPARDLVLNCNYENHRVHCLVTTRGCPYTCSFCADKGIWGGRVRRRSVGSVIKELQLLTATYDVECVDILDGTFTFDRKYIESFCTALIAGKMGIKWRCFARYDNLDEGILELMKQAGCSGMYFGLESGSNRMLNVMDKKTTVEQIIEVSHMVHASGIPSATSVLLGLPGETEEDVAATLGIMRRIETDIFDVNNYVPLPGSRLYDAMDEGERTAIDWDRVAYKSFDNHFSRDISLESLRKHLAEAYEIADDVRKRTLERFSATIGVSE